MNYSWTSEGRRRFGMPGLAAVAALLMLPAACVSPSTGVATGSPATGEEVARSQPAWREAMTRLPVPSAGCYRSAPYPRIAWRQIACVAPPNVPYPPARAPRPYTVGDGTDYSAEVTSGLMIGATGSFPTVTAVTSVEGLVGGVGSPQPNTFSLQLNVKPFPAPTACAGSPNTNCEGWQQFLYSAAYDEVFIQYWLLRYNATCPGGWATFQFTNDPDIYCWVNGASATTVTSQPQPSDLIHLSLTGTANAAGNDVVRLDSDGGTLGVTFFAAANPGNMLNLGNFWTGVEYILVGDCCGSEATFNAGATLEVRTTVHNQTTDQPVCVLQGYTGETNSLTLVGTPAATGPTPAPSITSMQSNIPGTQASCAAASGIGDTHLTTFGGLLYDFQATGDFLLAETGPDFAVQVRQVSGAPNWPNATVNQAVGMRIGRSRVTICLGDVPLRVDGRPVDLGSGARLDLPGGGDIRRTGNVYLVRGPSGDSVRVEINPGWINVYVGLGRWPSPVRGLLASAGPGGGGIAARDGTVFMSPFPFDTLYRVFGESWRVPAREALCNDCGGGPRESRNPTRPFYARDLEPRVAERARTICAGARVRQGPLLDACTLDVAVTGNEAAARAFVGVPPPRAAGEIVVRQPSRPVRR
jgi:hypothetical protein